VATYQKNKTPEAAEIKRERQAEAAREGAAAMAEYQADIIATREKTAKLRALRLAQEAKAAQAPKAQIQTKTSAPSARGKTAAPTARAKKTTSVNPAKKSASAKKPAARKAASR
jgi:hypothetical protein